MTLIYKILLTVVIVLTMETYSRTDDEHGFYVNKAASAGIAVGLFLMWLFL